MITNGQWKENESNCKCQQSRLKESIKALNTTDGMPCWWFKPRYHIFNVFSDDLRKRRKWKKEKMPKSDNCILVKNAERKNQFYSKMSKIRFLLRSFKDFQSFLKTSLKQMKIKIKSIHLFAYSFHYCNV